MIRVDLERPCNRFLWDYIHRFNDRINEEVMGNRRYKDTEKIIDRK